MTNSKDTIFFPPPLLPEAAGIFLINLYYVFLLKSDEIVLEFSSEFVSMLFY